MAYEGVEAANMAADLIQEHRRDLGSNGRIGKPLRYVEGRQDLPYAPRKEKVRKEFHRLAKNSVTNWLVLVSAVYRQNLRIDGYRLAGTNDMAPAWGHWQANGMDARQSVVFGSVVDTGVAYVEILKGEPTPLWIPVPSRKGAAWFLDDDADWPEVFVRLKGRLRNGNVVYEMVDDTYVHEFEATTSSERFRTVDGLTDSHGIVLMRSEPQAHGFSHVPVVRFRNRLDGDARGLIAPHIPLQDQINDTVFAIAIALQYQAFRQRWATGIDVPTIEDESDPRYGEPVEPFESAIDRLWVTENPDAKFGEFSQTELRGPIEAYTTRVRTLGSTAQIPPTIWAGDLVNLSADAMKVFRRSTDEALDELRTILGEDVEKCFRLSSAAAGDAEGAADMGAEVRWREIESESLLQTAQAIRELIEGAKVPPEGLWDRIPGATDQDIERWKELGPAEDATARLMAALERQAQPVPAGAPEAE